MNAQGRIPVKNIVLVHSAFAYRAGCEAVHRILTKQGFQVTTD
jgi:hypothetical protein